MNQIEINEYRKVNEINFQNIDVDIEFTISQKQGYRIELLAIENLFSEYSYLTKVCILNNLYVSINEDWDYKSFSAKDWNDVYKWRIKFPVSYSKNTIDEIRIHLNQHIPFINKGFENSELIQNALGTRKYNCQKPESRYDTEHKIGKDEFAKIVSNSLNRFEEAIEIKTSVSGEGYYIIENSKQIKHLSIQTTY